jgi:PBP1b-binding outer membrane lipoprotein LpoB
MNYNMRRNVKEQGERMKAHILVPLIALIAIIAGCASPPDQQKDAMQAKLDSLQETKVERHLPELCAEARDSFDAAVDEIAKQSDVSFLSRSFDHAERQLAYADSVLTLAVDSASRLNEESAAMMDSLRVRATAILDSAITLVVSLEDEKADDPEYKALRRKLVDHKLQIGLANKAYNDSEFTEAGTIYGVVIQGAEAVRRDLQTLR